MWQFLHSICGDNIDNKQCLNVINPLKRNRKSYNKDNHVKHDDDILSSPPLKKRKIDNDLNTNSNNNDKIQSKEDMVNLWMTDNVELPQYIDLLIKNGYDDYECIGDITLDELEQIGIDKIGHRKKIFKYAQKLKNIIPSNHESPSQNIKSWKCHICDTINKFNCYQCKLCTIINPNFQE